MVRRLQSRTVTKALKLLLGRGLSQGKEGVDFWPKKQLAQWVERGAC